MVPTGVGLPARDYAEADVCLRTQTSKNSLKTGEVTKWYAGSLSSCSLTDTVFLVV